MSEEKTLCGGCGSDLVDDDSSRQPCPICGDTKRIFYATASANVSASAHVDAEVISYPDVLLSLSEKLISENQFGVSIVVAHMACEISTERKLTSVANSRGLKDLWDSVKQSMNGYSLGNKKNLAIYRGSSGDSIQQEYFWSDYKNSCTLRNDVIHKGVIASANDAERSFTSASNFVSHMSDHS